MDIYLKWRNGGTIHIRPYENKQALLKAFHFIYLKAKMDGREVFFSETDQVFLGGKSTIVMAVYMDNKFRKPTLHGGDCEELDTALKSKSNKELDAVLKEWAG